MLTYFRESGKERKSNIYVREILISCPTTTHPATMHHSWESNPQPTLTRGMRPDRDGTYNLLVCGMMLKSTKPPGQGE